MSRLPPRSTLTDTLFPFPPLFRSVPGRGAPGRDLLPRLGSDGGGRLVDSRSLLDGLVGHRLVGGLRVGLHRLGLPRDVAGVAVDLRGAGTAPVRLRLRGVDVDLLVLPRLRVDREAALRRRGAQAVEEADDLSPPLAGWCEPVDYHGARRRTTQAADHH